MNVPTPAQAVPCIDFLFANASGCLPKRKAPTPSAAGNKARATRALRRGQLPGSPWKASIAAVSSPVNEWGVLRIEGILLHRERVADQGGMLAFKNRVDVTLNKPVHEVSCD